MQTQSVFSLTLNNQINGGIILVKLVTANYMLFMYTDGTTGHPKGVALGHSAFVSYILDNVDPASPDIEERNLLTVSFVSCGGDSGDVSFNLWGSNTGDEEAI